MPIEHSSMRFLATGIGSVPYLDLQATCRDILEQFPEMPFWPQFVRRSHFEDMTIQFTEALPLVRVDVDSKRLFTVTGEQREQELVKFYERFLALDTDYFRISEKYAPGLYILLEMLGHQTEHHKFVKGQIVGPITFCASVMGGDGKPVLHDTEIMEAMANGISLKALWQIKKLSSTGRKPILFFDEPYLSGFGSAFSPIGREEVVQILSTVIEFVRSKSDALLGIHCCGNTDWAMLLETRPDIINFDAHGYMEYFLLYKAEIKSFLERGGHIAWGIVPTSEFTGTETVDGLRTQLHEGMDKVIQTGVDRELLEARSLLTPSCGMGTMSPHNASLATKLLSELSRSLRQEH